MRENKNRNKYPKRVIKRKRIWRKGAHSLCAVLEAVDLEDSFKNGKLGFKRNLMTMYDTREGSSENAEEM